MIGKLLKAVGISDSSISKSAFLNSILPDYVPWMPSLFIISVTSKCNYKCVMCSRATNDIQGIHISKSVFLEASKYFVNRDVTFVGLGEPFLHPDIFEFIEICQSKNARVNIVTNGSLLTEDKDKWISSLKSLTFSIDGVGENYNKIRVNGDFKKVIDNLKRIKRLTKVSVNFVGMQSNIDDFPRLIEIVGDSVNSIQMVHPLCYSRSIGHLNRDVEHASRIFEESRELARKYNIQLTLPNLKPQTRGCINPWALPIIGMQGDIYPCHMLVSDHREPVVEFYDGIPVIPPEDASIGNIMDSGFMKIWNGSKIRQFRRDLKDISVSDLQGKKDYLEVRGKAEVYCELCPSRWGVAC